MSTIPVSQNICDRCGYAVLVGKYEPIPPPKWLYIQGFGDLCPSCASEFRSFATKFFDDKVPDEWDDIHNY